MLYSKIFTTNHLSKHILLNVKTIKQQHSLGVLNLSFRHSSRILLPNKIKFLQPKQTYVAQMVTDITWQTLQPNDKYDDISFFKSTPHLWIHKPTISRFPRLKRSKTLSNAAILDRVFFFPHEHFDYYAELTKTHKIAQYSIERSTFTQPASSSYSINENIQPYVTFQKRTASQLDLNWLKSSHKGLTKINPPRVNKIKVNEYVVKTPTSYLSQATEHRYIMPQHRFKPGLSTLWRLYRRTFMHTQSIKSMTQESLSKSIMMFKHVCGFRFIKQLTLSLFFLGKQSCLLPWSVYSFTKNQLPTNAVNWSVNGVFINNPMFQVYVGDVIAPTLWSIRNVLNNVNEVYHNNSYLIKSLGFQFRWSFDVTTTTPWYLEVDDLTNSAILIAEPNKTSDIYPVSYFSMPFNSSRLLNWKYKT